MKRFWIGIAVLSVLLVSGWAVAAFLEHNHAPISSDLAQAAQSALGGSMEQATVLAQDAHAKWRRCRDFTAAFADHSVLEEMDSLFAEIAVYAATGEAVAFAATCAHLSELAKAVSESHLPKWQNLL